MAASGFFVTIVGKMEKAKKGGKVKKMHVEKEGEEEKVGSRTAMSALIAPKNVFYFAFFISE